MITDKELLRAFLSRTVFEGTVQSNFLNITAILQGTYPFEAHWKKAKLCPGGMV
jgi:hypothetical protein